MRRLLPLSTLLSLLPGCGDCDVDPASAADYGELDAWLCRPDLPSDACRDPLPTVEVRPDESVVPHERDVAADPPFDCFYVYPTVDLSLRTGVHEDLADDVAMTEVVRVQAARFAEVCAVWAPRYRQVTIGTYAARDAVAAPCFETAYGDVERAFEAWLDAAPPERGVLLLGHSQGAQIVTRLLRERFDPDPALRARLVGAMPLGLQVGTAEGERTGGSSETVPTCASDDEGGCLLAYRSYAAGNEAPERTEDLEGDVEVCTHPGAVAAGTGRLSGAVFVVDQPSTFEQPEGLDLGDAEFALYRDYYDARCTAGGLEVAAAPGEGDLRRNPARFDSALLSGSAGTHVLDVQLGLLDLVERARSMGEAFADR